MENKPSAVTSPSSVQVEGCYQCGKCTAGCPMAAQMDLMPNQIVRLVQLGELERAAQSAAIWLCVSCQTCTTRCPKMVDCAGLMDELRQQAIHRHTASPTQQRIQLFHLAFLQNIRRYGRLNEVALIRLFKTGTFFKDLNVPLLFKDMLLAPKMAARSKLHLRGEQVRDRALVDRIFQRCDH